MYRVIAIGYIVLFACSLLWPASPLVDVVRVAAPCVNVVVVVRALSSVRRVPGGCVLSVFDVLMACLGLLGLALWCVPVVASWLAR